MIYPFAALVGQEQLKLALLLNAVYPGIGGVLIRGERGTAKSTAARSLADLLPRMSVVEGCPFRCDPNAPWPACPSCAGAVERRAVAIPVPFVELPLGATEDRVLGTLDLEKALHEGRRALQPGLLASAHRGILYVDEVNLLPDHLVDVLLDAAAMGVNTVQREGISVSHPSRFILIGTMNPEEGELRPQLLDRFGLVVNVTGARDPTVRTEIVRRRLSFEADSAAYSIQWDSAQAELRVRIVAARECLPQVALDDGLLTLISQVCCEFEVDGLRADLALHKAARARAAYEGRSIVTLDDVRVAAELVLPHRRKRKPFEEPQLSQEQLEQRLDELTRPPETECDAGCTPESQPEGKNSQDGAAERLFEAACSPVRRRFQVATDSEKQSPHGRRNPIASGDRGRYQRAVPDQKTTDLAVGATIRAAASRGVWTDGRVQIIPEDLHRKERAGRTGTLLIFVVDASGSMAARQRMETVKGAVLGLLRSAYEQRDEVALIAFRGLQAEVLLPPTCDVDLAKQALRVLPTGGRTPLAHGLVLAGEIASKERRRHPELPIFLIVVSDGRANVPLAGSADDPWQQSLRAAAQLAASNIPAMLLDTDNSFVPLGRVQQLAEALAATCLPLDSLSSETLALKLHQQCLAKGRK